MTPSEHLDAILRAGKIPRIDQIVDVEHYKYVWGSHQAIRHGDWVVHVPYGLMSDGASWVPDRVHAAFWVHDRLYLSPWADYKNVRKRVKKRQADLLYSMIALSRISPLAVLHGLILATGVNRSVWRKYRAQDEAALIESHTVPRPLCWDFRTQYTRDAVWLG